MKVPIQLSADKFSMKLESKIGQEENLSRANELKTLVVVVEYTETVLCTRRLSLFQCSQIHLVVVVHSFIVCRGFVQN